MVEEQDYFSQSEKSGSDEEDNKFDLDRMIGETFFKKSVEM